MMTTMKIDFLDSHCHFWNPDRLHYDWLADIELLNRPFTPDMLVAEAGKNPPQMMVFVQADCQPEDALAEVKWVAQLAKQYPQVAGIVAFAPLELGDGVTPILEKLAQEPLVKGVRRLIQSESAGFCLQPAFVEGVQSLARFGLSFDICVLHHQLEDVVQLVEQCPEVEFVLDHCGKPPIKSQQLDPWRGHVSALAGFNNVCCKLSGLVTEADMDNWRSADLKPYIEHVLAAFGPQRLMFGGDWPVSKLATTYPRWLEEVCIQMAHLAPAEQRSILLDNGRRFYRI